MWDIINKKREKRKKINEKLEMSEWKKHFMRTLGGVEQTCPMPGE